MASEAEILIPSTVLTQDVDFFKTIGFKVHSIYPADDPAVTIMCGHRMRIRLDRNADHSCPSPVIIILTDNYLRFLPDGKSEVVAPNGTVVKIRAKTFCLKSPATRHAFHVCKLRDDSCWTTGRAGMLYRDLIPDRLGGAIIASHISIPSGGPVQDNVHYHTINFQLIYCYKGWVKVVYEDQDTPFILETGDCVIQPPEIRHRVLESSKNVEVVEIGVPNEHMTTIDHEMELPTSTYRPDRMFSGQTFCHHQLKNAIWAPSKLDGFEFRETGVEKATNGLACVHFIRPVKNAKVELPISSHNSDIFFAFVIDGTMELYVEEHGTQSLTAGDAYVLPPNVKHKMTDYSSNLELLEVTLPN